MWQRERRYCRVRWTNECARLLRLRRSSEVNPGVGARRGWLRARSWGERAHAIIRSKTQKPCSPTTPPLHLAAPISPHRNQRRTIYSHHETSAPPCRRLSPHPLSSRHTPTQWPRDTVWTTREIPAHGWRYLISAVHSAWEYVQNEMRMMDRDKF